MYYYKEVKKPNLILGKVLLNIIKKYLQKKADISVEINDTKKIKPPYLILGNHVSYWDPFLVNIFIDEPMCYIAGAVYFRNPILRFFLNLAGSIPKKKFMTHYLPIKRLIQARENGRILGIFPEGERKWDGTTDEMNYRTTAKLIKKLNVPVVAVNIKGGYLVYPRWAKSPRKGKINLAYKLSLTEEEVLTSSIEEIENKIKKDLFHDEFSYQKNSWNKYIGNNLAEHLEHFLFLCPNCHSINSLISQHNELYCNRCSYKVIYNQYGLLEEMQKKIYFDNLRDWNCWQKSYLEEFVNKKIESSVIETILQDDSVEMLEGSFEKAFKSMGVGRLHLNRDGLYFSLPNETEKQFKLKKITGLNVQFHAVLEFNYKEKMYHFKFLNQHISAYKWVLAINYCKKENKLNQLYYQKAVEAR